MSTVRLAAPLAAIALAAGCATSGRHFDAHLASASPAVRTCAQWYTALDGEVARAGVGDAQYARVAGFPYLRADRFHASLRSRAAQSRSAMQGYADRLLELELESRHHEIRNLPQPALDALASQPSGATAPAVMRRTAECARLLREIDLAKDEARGAIAAAVEVPDEYSAAQRMLGIYPITRLLFAAGVRRWEAETLERFQSAPGARAAGAPVRYSPPHAALLQRGTVAGILARAEFDTFGIPSLSARELSQMALAYAPSFEVSLSGSFDRFGKLRWRRGEPVPEADAAEAAVYAHPAYARYGDRVLLQLGYHVWFPERPAEAPGDLLAGHLDGVIWRVTLAPDGEPLIYDSIHSCGCYHLFFPTPRARLRPAPESLDEWALVAQVLPRVEDQARPIVSLAARTHYIERVSVARGADSLARYVLRPYDELRSLPTLEGSTRSIFGPDGLVKGTERAERFVFWPTGVASAGTLRQWGRHATAFVGRRHFDDADLLERRFELDLESPQ